MIRQLLLTLTILAFAACLTPAMGQISAADTFKVVDVTAAAGSIVHVQLLVTNNTATLMGIGGVLQDRLECCGVRKQVGWSDRVRQRSSRRTGFVSK